MYVCINTTYKLHQINNILKLIMKKVIFLKVVLHNNSQKISEREQWWARTCPSDIMKLL